MDGVATKTRGTPWRESLPACRLGNKPTWLRSLLKPPVNVYRAFDLDGFGIQSGRIILCVAGRAHLQASCSGNKAVMNNKGVGDNSTYNGYTISDNVGYCSREQSCLPQQRPSPSPQSFARTRRIASPSFAMKSARRRVTPFACSSLHSTAAEVFRLTPLIPTGSARRRWRRWMTR